MKNWLYMIREKPVYLVVVTFFFLIGSGLGYIYVESLDVFLNKIGIFNGLQETINEMENNTSFFNIFFIILINNIWASLSIMCLGLFFGLIPLLSMLVNGVILGVTLVKVSEAVDMHPLFLFITSILPHGILEIPALILAATFGLRCGVIGIYMILSLFNSQLREKIYFEWRLILKRLPVFLSVIWMLLTFAAIIEASLIVWIK